LDDLKLLMFPRFDLHQEKSCPRVSKSAHRYFLGPIMSHKSIQIINQEHATISAMLYSIEMMERRGPKGNRALFFEVLRSMLFYIDEFPEKQHHPKENLYLFPPVLKKAPELKDAIEQLELDHKVGEYRIRELQHLLLRWEILGDEHQASFKLAYKKYHDFYLHHLQLENSLILPKALKVLDEREWALMDEAFEENTDPWLEHSGQGVYQNLFSKITNHAPAPIGLGEQ